MVFLLVIHEGCDSTTLVGMVTSLATDTNGSTANAKVIGRTRNGAEGRRH